MATHPIFTAKALNAYTRTYDVTQETTATQTRLEFLKAFPLKELANLKLENYVMGHQTPTFCTHVEVRTRAWANIQGATAKKFGIYFGRSKQDETKIYRFSPRFGATKNKAFASVKAALLALLSLGKAAKPDFEAIDANPLSQMFKAKILSLYFPNKFLNVCSATHLAELGVALGFDDGLASSRYQHLLLLAKEGNAISSAWSNPKFMAFLYDTILWGDQEPIVVPNMPGQRAHPAVNFEDIQAQRDAIGKAAEAFALAWEVDRLEACNLGHLVPKIKDRHDRPGYGYDFLSHSADDQPRFVEVKSVRKLPGGGRQFFLSDNELQVSLSAGHQSEYYFYLVFFNGKSLPVELKAIRAAELYPTSSLAPATYTLRFDL